MAQQYGMGSQAGLNSGNVASGVQQAKQLNQQALQRAGQANFEIAGPLAGQTGAAGVASAGNIAGAGMTGTAGAQSGAAQVKQLNQQSMQRAATKGY